MFSNTDTSVPCTLKPRLLPHGSNSRISVLPHLNFSLLWPNLFVSQKFKWIDLKKWLTNMSDHNNEKFEWCEIKILEFDPWESKRDFKVHLNSLSWLFSLILSFWWLILAIFVWMKKQNHIYSNSYSNWNTLFKYYSLLF